MNLRSVTASLTSISLVILALGGCSSSSSNASKSVSSACTSPDKFTTLNSKTLTVATLDGPPYAGYDGSKLTGVDGAILTAFAASECLKVSVKDMAAAAVIPTVQTGRADIAAGGWYRSKARAQIVDLSAPIYLDQTAIVSKEGFTSFNQLKGKTVGTMSGCIWTADLQKLLGSSLHLYATPAALEADVKVGRISYEVNSLGNATYALGPNTPFKVKVAATDPAVAGSGLPAQTGFPIHKGESSLVEAMNKFIAKIRGNGELAKMLSANGFAASAADVGAPRLI
jgi:polar amino acid transport system substrate-binding protein